MIPEELYKRRRRHNKTPKSTLLILANFITVLVATSLFASCNKINWFFWVIIGLLGVYNFFDIRRYRDEYNKVTIIAYVISLVVLVVLFFLFKIKGQNC
ncbi:MAG: hypothetical protein JWR67_1122 [Mucilaginibacter sp.]|nr:hypothetical protein [Mucilaginibacter sp.]